MSPVDNGHADAMPDDRIKRHFYYFITGRIDGDDEDTGLVFEAPDADAAIEAYIDQMRDDREDDDYKPTLPELPVYINYVLLCGSKPHILQSPPC